MESKKKGNYFGTEIDHSWYKRFRKDGFFARGNGEFWLEDDGLYFLRKLTKTPLHISVVRDDRRHPRQMARRQMGRPPTHPQGRLPSATTSTSAPASCSAASGHR